MGPGLPKQKVSGLKAMSVNCINCVVNDRTGSDLLCDECRRLALPEKLRKPCGDCRPEGMRCPRCVQEMAAADEIDSLRDRIDDLELTCAKVREVVQLAAGGPFRPDRPLVEDVGDKITLVITSWKDSLAKEHQNRIDAAEEGSRYKSLLLLERQKVRLLHDATIMARHALLEERDEIRRDCYVAVTKLIDQVKDATRTMEPGP